MKATLVVMLGLMVISAGCTHGPQNASPPSQNNTPTSQTGAVSGYLGILIPPPYNGALNLTESINNRIVQIVFISEGNNITPLGTGFLLNKDGYVVTANHIIDLGEHYVKQTNNLNPPPVKTTANYFDIIAKDSEHDLALLKVKMITGITPGFGQILSTAKFVGGMGGTLQVGEVPFAEGIQPGITIAITTRAITGYFLDQMTTETKTGVVTSQEISNVTNSRISLTSGSVSYNITNYYQTDIISNPSWSGSPVYSTTDGTILGISINTIQNEPPHSIMAVIIPSSYILALLGNR